MPDCVTEITGEGKGGLSNNQWYAPKVSADGVLSYTFTVKAINPTSWTFNDGIPFAFVVNKATLKDDGTIDQNWESGGAFKGANVAIGTKDSATTLQNNAVSNAGTTGVAAGDKITINVLPTFDTSDNNKATAAKAWIVKQ